MAPSGVNLTFKELVDALTYKTKAQKDSFLNFSIAELDSLERKLQIVASAIRGRRNSLQKINQLPTELLSIIFHHVQLNLTSFLPDDTDYLDHGRDWQCMLQICRHWRGVIARCPGMWRVVDNTNVSEVYLRRSQSAPLTVYLGIKKPEFQRDVLDLLHPHLPRVREFHMAADGFELPQDLTITDTANASPNAALYSSPLLTSPAPMLQSLSIGTYGKDPAVAGGALPALFSSQTPRLVQVDLEYFTSWPQDHFHNLTHLCLSYQNEPTRPSTQAFLDFLEASAHSLEELALVRAGPTLDDATDVPPLPGRRKVHLPQMRELNLGEWPTTSTIGRFLSHVVIPPTSDLYIWGTILSDPFADLASMIPADTSGLENLQAITKWYLTHFFASQIGELLYTPFLAIVGSSKAGRKGAALHTYGPFQPARLLETIPRFPLDDIGTFVVRDSSLQTNRFSMSSWKEILLKMNKLEELRVLAFQSMGTTRGVLGALMPKDQMVVDDIPNSKGTNGHLAGSSSGGRPGLTTTTTSPSTQSSSSSLPKTHPQVVCPRLRYLTIEHDADLASIFIAKLVRSRRRAGSYIEKLKVLVFDPRGPGGSRRISTNGDSRTGSPPPHPPGPTGSTQAPPTITILPPPPPPPPIVVVPPPPGHHSHVPVHIPQSPSSTAEDDNEDDGENDSNYDSEAEYRIRSDESYELLRSCCDDLVFEDGWRPEWDVEFVHGMPLSRDLVPPGWPTNVWVRTGGAS
ncbi:hypothetical protein PM082_005924 [Marasmius tenuissimus]|nr:hypothetical protein PM082_005924 [Marasmius tenuissimus]